MRLPDTPKQINEFAHSARDTVRQQVGPLTKWSHCDPDDIIHDVLVLVLIGEEGSIEERDPDNLYAADGPVYRQLEDTFNEFSDPLQALVDSIVLTVRYRLGQIEQGRKDHPGAFRMSPDETDENATKEFRRFSFIRKIQRTVLLKRNHSSADDFSDELVTALDPCHNREKRVEELVPRLTDKQREVFERLWNGIPQIEIAAELGISTAAVTFRKQSAIAFMKQHLK